ncbi:28S ribosomal protein S35, mitochondrial [Halotydeus destructor]|nr:28S ribosomal protein S35, mitochondrial [Halotydeus destructor]
MCLKMNVHKFTKLSTLSSKYGLLPIRTRFASTTSSDDGPKKEDDEFRTLELIPKTEDLRRKRSTAAYRVSVAPPRAKRMSTDQDWSAVWPAARVFHPAVVPLPLHMGYVKKPEMNMPPGKFANVELMKIPNFLHLTPPAIKQQCQALKQFCTEWPKELKTDEDCFESFPMQFEYRDYVHAGPTIRDPRARVVTMTFKMDVLELDYHSKDKLKRLLNSNGMNRYDADSGLITVTADRCPLKRQNYDYLHYLLTAVYFEAWKHDAWEEEKEQTDWERFYFEKSPSKDRLVSYLKEVSPEEVTDETHLMEKTEVKLYADALAQLYDNGETEETVEKYKESVEKLLFRPAATKSDSPNETV